MSQPLPYRKPPQPPAFKVVLIGLVIVLIAVAGIFSPAVVPLGGFAKYVVTLSVLSGLLGLSFTIHAIWDMFVDHQ